jgi:hypothetical protein
MAISKPITIIYGNKKAAVLPAAFKFQEKRL